MRATEIELGDCQELPSKTERVATAVAFCALERIKFTADMLEQGCFTVEALSAIKTLCDDVSEAFASAGLQRFPNGIGNGVFQDFRDKH